MTAHQPPPYHLICSHAGNEHHESRRQRESVGVACAGLCRRGATTGDVRNSARLCREYASLVAVLSAVALSATAGLANVAVHVVRCAACCYHAFRCAFASHIRACCPATESVNAFLVDAIACLFTHLSVRLQKRLISRSSTKRAWKRPAPLLARPRQQLRSRTIQTPQKGRARQKDGRRRGRAGRQGGRDQGTEGRGCRGVQAGRAALGMGWSVRQMHRQCWRQEAVAMQLRPRMSSCRRYSWAVAAWIPACACGAWTGQLVLERTRMHSCGTCLPATMRQDACARIEHHCLRDQVSLSGQLAACQVCSVRCKYSDGGAHCMHHTPMNSVRRDAVRSNRQHQQRLVCARARRCWHWSIRVSMCLSAITQLAAVRLGPPILLLPK